jgi:hypothetical protein
MILRILVLLAWTATGIVAIFLAAGIIGYLDGVKQDYSPVLYAIPFFLLCLTFARAISRHVKSQHGSMPS